MPNIHCCRYVEARLLLNSRNTLANVLQSTERATLRLKNSIRHRIAERVEGNEVLSASNWRGLRVAVCRSVAGIRRNEEDSIAAANDEFVRDAIAHSETRTERWSKRCCIDPCGWAPPLKTSSPGVVTPVPAPMGLVALKSKYCCLLCRSVRGV